MVRFIPSSSTGRGRGLPCRGQLSGFFDQPAIRGTHLSTTSDGSMAVFAASQPRTTIVFECRPFINRPSSPDDPLVLGRLTLVQDLRIGCARPIEACLNLALHVGAPRPATRLLPPLRIRAGTGSGNGITGELIRIGAQSGSCGLGWFDFPGADAQTAGFLHLRLPADGDFEERYGVIALRHHQRTRRRILTHPPV